mgnify:CR=1 FL=1
MTRSPVSANIKIVLVVLAMGIVVALLIHTQSIVRKLQEREHRYADLYVKALEYIGSESASNADLTLITDEIINKIDFPIIIADPEHRPSGSKNIEIDSTLGPEGVTRFLEGKRDAMASTNPPLALLYQDTIVTQYVYYDESDTVKQLRALPYIEIAVAALFIFIGYISFSYIKRSEQANIWVGMSKETAHQLGTPLSSMMGWLALLRERDDLAADSRALMDEMDNDVQRLERIALRFSKIGSKPELVEQNLIDTVNRSVDYYRKRIPRLGKTVHLAVKQTQPLRALCNAELLEWVFENLMKNALDAIEGENGSIEFALTRAGRYAVIDVTDSGKGIEKRRRKDIFRPGYSTKKRGWGLGLSLSRRIVENYHRGRLFVLSSDPGKGTTFRITLKG